MWRVQRIEGQLVLSPTDLTKHLACPNVTTLDLAALDSPRGAGAPHSGAKTEDEALNLVFSKGIDHEMAYLERLRRAGLVVTEIPTRHDVVGRIEAERETLEAMRAGADVIYQATFYDGQWGGQADFLLRNDRPSDLGDWSYDIADTKLARRLKVPALLQMATYGERLAQLQGVHPEFLTVVTGDGVEHPWRLADVASYARRARSRLRNAVESRPATEPVPVAHCSQCRWKTRCTGLWEATDDLSLVAGMRKNHRQALVAAGISTVADLGKIDAADLPHSIGRPSRERLTQQARLQMVERTTGAPKFELLAPESGKGLLGLPIIGGQQRTLRHQLRHTSASVLYLRNQSLNFAELGTLDASADASTNDACRASCVDWYGNSRPLFIRNRVLALMGYELVEGQLGRDGIAETRRVNFSPLGGFRPRRR